MDIEQVFDRIRRKLAELRSRDPGCRNFGAKTHRYILNRCARPQQVTSFERSNAVSLPEEYRRFLLEVGNGGAGPHNGLVPLESCLYSSEDGPYSLAEKFPHASAWNPAGDFDPTPFEREKDPEKAIRDLEAAWRAIEKDYFKNCHVNGALVLADQGCARLSILVVTGQERGTVWCDDRPNDGGVCPECPHQPSSSDRFEPLYTTSNTAQCTFLEWYEHWLDVGLRPSKSL